MNDCISYKFLATVYPVSLFGSGDLEYFAFHFCQKIAAELDYKFHPTLWYGESEEGADYCDLILSLL